MYRDPDPRFDSLGGHPVALRPLRVGMIGIGTVGAGPLVVSCGNQRRQSVVVVAPCGHVGKSQSGLSTCPCGLVVHELEAVS